MHACQRPCQTAGDRGHRVRSLGSPPNPAVTRFLQAAAPLRWLREDRMRQHLTDRLRFLRAFLAHPRQVGAVLPTSHAAVRDMLDMADIPGAQLVVELGAGTGVQTGEILARLGPDARLLSFEIDPDLARLLDE